MPTDETPIDGTTLRQIAMTRDPSVLPLDFDREQAFILYATFCGDLERTAHVLSIRPVQLLRLVDEDGWVDKLKPILELKKSNRPGDVERAMNRAMNFAQAHALRLFINRVIFKLTNMTPEEFQKYLLSDERTTERGQFIAAKFTTRALADLASALEKCQSLTYMALNDSAPERAKRNDESDETAAAELHVKLAQAMTDARESKSVRAQLFDGQMAQANAAKHEAAKAKATEASDRAAAERAPGSPYNQDD